MDFTHVRFAGTPLSPLRGANRVNVPALPTAHRSPERTPLDGLAATLLCGAGLDPLQYRASALNRRVPACLRAVRSSREPNALSALLIGFSGFFRDADVFLTLDLKVLPQLDALNRPLRVLSVGSSAGQELYSIAMLLAEHGLLPESELVGIDCRSDAIRTAREAVFPDGLLGDVPDGLRARYLTPGAGGFRIQDQIRSRTRWQVMDATSEIPPGPWDLILCRNLFIYLQPRTIDAMLARMLGQLSPTGFFVVGKAERPPASLGLKSIGRCVYRRHAP